MRRNVITELIFLFFFFLDCYRFGLLIVLESLRNKYLRVLGSIGNWIFRRGRGGDC